MKLSALKQRSSLVKTLDNEPFLDTEDLQTPMTSSPKRKSKLLLKILGVFAVILIAFGVFTYFALVVPAKRVLVAVKQLEASGKAVMPYAQAQDLKGVETQIKVVKADLENVNKQYQAMAWMKAVPVAKNYYSDGVNGLSAAKDLLEAGEISISAIAPYADVIGLKGLATTGDGGKTAQDRIDFIVNTLDKLRPELDKIGAKLASAKTSLDKIDPNRYPEKFQKYQVRDQLAQGILLVDQASSVVNDAKPLLESAPYILGNDSPRKYLVLFQNDAELRPTGGFLTGYAIINVSKGKISTVESDDIYKLDEKFPKKIPAPAPILKYMPLVPYWYLRDQNLSPDFRVSMDTFMPNYNLTKSPQVDGIIAVDTRTLVELLKVTGPIGVPGLGTFSADSDQRCNCPQVFYELQLLAGGEEPVVWDSVSGKIIKAPANYGNRKAFLGPLMYSILANVMAQPKSKMPLLFNTGLNAIAGKHILVYFTDTKAQAAAESFNMAGRVKETENDYLYVVNTNFSGAKTNIWVNYKADQKVEIGTDGSVTKTVTLTYSNPQQTAVKITQARNLNGLFRDWLRVYVPEGSQLIEAKGFESGQTNSSDLGKTVFEGFFTLAPGNTKQISLKYKLPNKLKSPYKLVIQKQGGVPAFPYTLSINGRNKPEILLNADQELSYPY